MQYSRSGNTGMKHTCTSRKCSISWIGVNPNRLFAAPTFTENFQIEKPNPYKVGNVLIYSLTNLNIILYLRFLITPGENMYVDITLICL